MTLCNLGRLTLQPILVAGNNNQVRGFATLKDISIRLKSVKNIQKITKSMKMVAAAKYAKAERELKGARAYGLGAQSFYDNIGYTQSEGETQKTSKKLLVLVTSDRGLCGSVHTSIVKVQYIHINTAKRKYM